MFASKNVVARACVKAKPIQELSFPPFVASTFRECNIRSY